MSNYQNLEVWKESMELVKLIYIETKKFPKEELFGLTSQIKRAAVSVPANIAEGMGRQYKKDTIQFIHIARGSLYELETLLHIAVMADLMEKKSFSAILLRLERSLKLINGLLTYLKKSNLR